MRRVCWCPTNTRAVNPTADDTHTHTHIHAHGDARNATQGDILEDIELIENLEETKRMAVEIEDKVAQARATEVSISVAREVYRPVAARGSQVYFLIDSLNALDRCARVRRLVPRFGVAGAELPAGVTPAHLHGTLTHITRTHAQPGCTTTRWPTTWPS
jgi:hypothetical protein